MASMAVVNGPIRNEIGMNAGTGALGPYSHANATIGRAYGLLSQNGQGGSVPGHSYMGNQGNNYAYNSVTFAENEERSPWEPFHVQHGFKADGQRGQRLQRLPLDRLHARAPREALARARAQHAPRHGPAHAADAPARSHRRAPVHRPRRLHEEGRAHRLALRDGDACRRASTGTTQLIQNYIYPRATFGEEPWASKLKAAPDELIPIFRREDIHVVVVGGETNGYWRIMGCNYQKTVSVDEWR